MFTKLHTHYRRLIEYLLPNGTRRRKLYHVGVMSLRTIFKNKKSSFLKYIERSQLKKQSEQTSTPSQETQTPVNHKIIFVYQMGRVGSKSIQTTLEIASKKQNQPLTVIHGHWLNEFELLTQRAKKDLADSSKFETGIINAKELKESVLHITQQQKIKLVSLVRDPIERNVSTFFFALDEFIPDWEAKLSTNTLSLGELHSIFESKRLFVLSAFNWFDEQMKPIFDIDVYSTPFPKDIGYKIYSTPNVDLLLFRLENLNERAKEAFKEFLDIKDFKLLRVNTGEERKTGSLYHSFKRRPLSPNYVEWTYGTKIAHHFYTDDELISFTRKWTKS